MVKKVLLWSIYAGVVGVLIFGAVIRTEAKNKQESSQPEARLENRSAETEGQGSGGQGWVRNNEEMSDSGQVIGKNINQSSRGQDADSAQVEDHTWIQLIGVVVSLDREALRVETNQKEILEINGRAWRYVLESELMVEMGDVLELEGFFEHDQFKISSLTNATSGESLPIREESGQPLWSGGGK
jgi:hypothetical protein